MKDCRYVKPEDFGTFDAIACIGGLEHFCSVEDWQAGNQEKVYRDFFQDPVRPIARRRPVLYANHDLQQEHDPLRGV